MATGSAPKLKVAGDAILHPAALAALALLVLNDHVLKAAFPGQITGKLSDAAGLAFFPLLLLGAWELALLLAGRWRWPSRRSAIAVVVVTGLGFVLVKTTAPGAEAFGTAIGFGQWLAGIPGALATAMPLGAAQPARVLADPGDLVALPALLLPLIIGLRRASAAVSASSPEPAYGGDGDPVGP